jgi:hypothetical protein
MLQASPDATPFKRILILARAALKGHFILKRASKSREILLSECGLEQNWPNSHIPIIVYRDLAQVPAMAFICLKIAAGDVFMAC